MLHHVRPFRAIIWAIGCCLALAALAPPANVPVADSAIAPPDLAWRRVDSHSTDGLASISMGSSTAGWALTYSNSLLRWNGATWTPVNITVRSGCDLNDLEMASDNLGWIVGDCDYNQWPLIMGWNGSTWMEVPNGIWDLGALQSLSVASPTAAMAVGGVYDSSPCTITRWDGAAWTEDSTGVSCWSLWSADISSAGEGWVVGWDGDWYETLYLRLHGGWTNIDGPESIGRIRALASVSTNDAWIMNDSGRILRWDGSTWNDVPSPTTQGMGDIDMLSATDGWAVGSGGTILHWDGSAWNLAESPVATALNSVDMLSPTEGWAAGAGGVILRYSPGYEMYLPQMLYNPVDCGVLGTWEPGASMPQPVARAAGVWLPFNGRFYVLGGRSADAAGNEILTPYEYDPQGNVWTRKAAHFDDARVNNMVAAELHTPDSPLIYTVGGSQVGVITTTDAVRVYNPVADTLTVLAGDPWPGNAMHDVLPGGAAVYANKLYVLGGYRPGVATLDQIWEFNPDRPAGARWALMPAVLPVALMHIPAATIGDAIYTAGGVYWDGTRLVDTTHVFRYEPLTNNITVLADLPRPAGQTSAVAVGDKLWLLGGGVTPSNEVDVYDPATNAWSLGIPFTTPRRLPAADTDPATGRIFIAGGYAPTSIGDGVEVFVPETPCRRP